jgi:ABC-type sugar transport system ATPase subunit
MEDYILQAKGIIKSFPGVKALNCVNLNVKKGEVHAIVGENGAGKSTLMLTLGGIYKPDAGEIYLDGEKQLFDSPHDANVKGISIVYQELSLVPNLSVAENIFANRQPIRSLNFINWDELCKRTREMLMLFHIDFINPMELVQDLSLANQQVVEILKAMSFNPKVLILDEPTSSLTDVEVKQLFKNIRVLKDKGISFIYISHHLKEIFEIADTVTVLRDGEYICNAVVKDINEEFLITKMVGRKIENIYGIRDADAVVGDTLFEAKNISRANVFRNVSFKVKSGEILGFAGLIGAGRTEVGRAIFGSEPIETGELFLNGEKIRIKNPGEAIKNGIGYLSEDRKSQGLYLDFNIKQNFISNKLRKFSINGFINEKRVNENGQDGIMEFNVASTGVDQIVSNLSGGNQQKILIGTWFGIKPKLLIVDEPTRGVDVGARSEIYTLIRKLAKTGVGIIMISSDLPEILGLSDRIIVMKDRKIVGELKKEDANEENVIYLATGTETNVERCI